MGVFDYDSASSGDTVRVMVLDDSPHDRALAAHLLEPACQVFCASSAAEAEARLHRGPSPDLFLVDFNLVGETGADAVQRLRPLLEAQQIGVVFYSADPSQIDGGELLGLGALAILEKPLALDYHLPMLQRLGEKVRQRQRMLRSVHREHALAARWAASLPPLADAPSIDRDEPLRSWTSRLDMMVRGGASNPWVVLACELVNFHDLQLVNDVLAHDCAAQVCDNLEQIFGSDAIRVQLEPGLLLMATELSSTIAVTQVPDFLAAVLRAAMQPKSPSAAPHIAVGWTHLRPDTPASAEDLRQQALTALQEADSENGALQILPYLGSGAATSPNALEDALMAALQANRIEPWYEAQEDLVSGALVGAEALARWPLPEGRFVSPAQFIPVAERSGLIHSLGRAIRRRVVTDILQWPNLPPGFRVAVNVSVLELAHPMFFADLQDDIAHLPNAPDYLELEITESAMTLDTATLCSRLVELADMGFTLALDDFGTGYAALGLLHRLPLDRIKIDRCFAVNSEAQAGEDMVVKSAVQWGKVYGFECLQEGLETAEQYAAARSLGVGVGQGWYIGRTQSAKDFATRLLAGSMGA